MGSPWIKSIASRPANLSSKLLSSMAIRVIARNHYIRTRTLLLDHEYLLSHQVQNGKKGNNCIRPGSAAGHVLKAGGFDTFEPLYYLADFFVQADYFFMNDFRFFDVCLKNIQ